MYMAMWLYEIATQIHFIVTIILSSKAGKYYVEPIQDTFCYEKAIFKMNIRYGVATPNKLLVSTAFTAYTAYTAYTAIYGLSDSTCWASGALWS